MIDRIVAGEQRDENLALLEDLCELMTDGSLCAMGGLTPMPVRSAVTHFSDDFLTRGEGRHDTAQGARFGTPERPGGATVTVGSTGCPSRCPRAPR